MKWILIVLVLVGLTAYALKAKHEKLYAVPGPTDRAQDDWHAQPKYKTQVPCERQGKTADPETEAALKEKCGNGGPAFKPTPHTRTY